MKHSFLWIAILLVVIWVVARVVLAVTSVALHLLWVLPVIAIIIWLIKRVSTARSCCRRRPHSTAGSCDPAVAPLQLPHLINFDQRDARAFICAADYRRIRARRESR